MGLFYEILSSINNPDQQGSVEQLSSLVNSVQQTATTHGVDTATLQSVLSSVGSLLKPALQQSTLGSVSGSGGLVGQLVGGSSGASLSNLASIIPPQLQQQIIETVAQKTGLDASTINSMLPGLLSTVVGFLNMGTSSSESASNSVLDAFVNEEGNDIGFGEVYKFANRFLNPPNK